MMMPCCQKLFFFHQFLNLDWKFSVCLLHWCPDDIWQDSLVVAISHVSSTLEPVRDSIHFLLKNDFHNLYIFMQSAALLF
jgi:hypothetical protein